MKKQLPTCGTTNEQACLGEDEKTKRISLGGLSGQAGRYLQPALGTEPKRSGRSTKVIY